MKEVFKYFDNKNLFFLQKISSGAINVAEETLEYLINIFSQKLNPSDVDGNLIDVQQKALGDVLRELIRQVCFLVKNKFKN